MAKQITDADLQVALRLTDEQIEMMRDFERNGENDPSSLPLVELVRVAIGYTTPLDKQS